MAIYTYRCPRCDTRKEVVQSIRSYCEKPEIPACHGPMERCIVATLVNFDTAPWAAYQSPIDGSMITSRSERREHMAKHGVVPTDEIMPDVIRNKKRMQEKFKADIKQDIATAFQMADAGYKPIIETEAIPGA